MKHLRKHSGSILHKVVASTAPVALSLAALNVVSFMYLFYESGSHGSRETLMTVLALVGLMLVSSAIVSVQVVRSLDNLVLAPIRELSVSLGRAAETKMFSAALHMAGVSEIDDLYRSADKLFEELREHHGDMDKLHSGLLEEIRKRTEVEASLRRVNEDLSLLANKDGLTGLSNRRGLDQFMDALWEDAERRKSCISLIMCDIDFFKQYNDTYGHLAGDECLRRVARGLSRAIRGRTDLIARYGGEEFVAVLPGAGASAAMNIATMMMESIKDCHLPHRTSPMSDRVTISLGVLVLQNGAPGTAIEDVLIAADEALYKSKKEGRDRITLMQL